MTTTNLPTPRMLDAARVIASFTEARGYPPSLSEIGERLGITHGRVRDLVSDARDRGLVTYEDRKPRTLRGIDRKALRKDRGKA